MASWNAHVKKMMSISLPSSPSASASSLSSSLILQRISTSRSSNGIIRRRNNQYFCSSTSSSSSSSSSSLLSKRSVLGKSFAGKNPIIWMNQKRLSSLSKGEKDMIFVPKNKIHGGKNLSFARTTTASRTIRKAERTGNKYVANQPQHYQSTSRSSRFNANANTTKQNSTNSSSLPHHNRIHSQPLHIMFINNHNNSSNNSICSFQIHSGYQKHKQHQQNNMYGISFQQMQCFSSTSSSSSSSSSNNNDKNNPHDENKTNNKQTQHHKKYTQTNKNPAAVDQEFVDYLTGKLGEDTSPFIQKSNISPTISNSNSDGTSTSSSANHQDDDEQSISTQTTSSSSSSSTTSEYFNIPIQLGKTNTKELNETYKNIELTQSINIENSRKKRLITVRRALAGNVIIATSKLAAFLHSGSSAMMSEFVHSVVDCGNQSLLLVGLRDSGNVADRDHSYGYGKSIYFWALVSALGTFFLGAGVSMTQAIPNLIYGSNLHEITWHVWSVLGFSFVVDGYVFTRTLMEVRDTMPKNTTLWRHITTMRDPATLAILLEDGAACLGVVMAIGGLGLTQAFDMPVYDALAGVGISGLLATMGIVLVRVNHSFLLGQSVDLEIREGIEKILLNRKSIDAVHSVQSQWTGAETFSFKAEVDFDGTFLAAKLMPRYQQEFAEAKATLDQDLRVLLSWYAEDVMRTVEREVRNIEAEIRKEYPGAQYIELEPMSKDADRFAIDDGLEASLKRIEIESLNRYLKSLYESDLVKSKAGAQSIKDKSGDNDDSLVDDNNMKKLK